MTISSPNFTRLQDGVKSVDDLRVRGPLNVALAWLGGGLVTQLNTHFGAVSNSISAQIATLLATANTWTAVQTIEPPTGSTVLNLNTSVAGGPVLNLTNIATGTVNAEIGQINFIGRDDQGNAQTYAFIDVRIPDPADASEDGELRIVTVAAGAQAARITARAGVQIGSPTGGDQGAGTLNMDNAIFRDGTQVVGARVTGYGDPFGAISRATISVTTVTTAALASFVAAMYTDLKAHGLLGN
jgi:hypothetical protein